MVPTESNDRVHLAQMRRAPVQARSAERVQLLLDTAAALIEEGGLEAVTTSRLAKRSRMSIGAVYRFFPDRLAVLVALAARNRERYLASVAGALAADAPPTPAGTVEVLIDHLAWLHRDEPGFTRLRFGDGVGVDGAEEVAADLHDLLVVPRRRADTAASTLRFRVAVALLDAVVAQAFAHDRAGDPLVLNEARALAVAYLGRAGRRARAAAPDTAR